MMDPEDSVFESSEDDSGDASHDPVVEYRKHCRSRRRSLSSSEEDTLLETVGAKRKRYVAIGTAGEGKDE